ncbi:MAG TPA: YggS family pyridoxal phosphate-dependent enzyme [Marmoricola sp.]
MTRRDELAANLTSTRARIARACLAAGRDPAEVALTVVTKNFPAADVRLLADLGVTDVGENRHQEAQAKHADCVASGVTDLRWHFIGGLQSNKAAAVARYADVVESVDRPKLVGALARGAGETGRTVDVLVQVSLDPPDGAGARAGAAPGDIRHLAELIAAEASLRLRGVMAVAPLGADPAPAFVELARLAAEVRAVDGDATWISAGMSGDLEAAVAAGATHVRIGSAILGMRPPIK